MCRFLPGYRVLWWTGQLHLSDFLSEGPDCVGQGHVQIQGHPHSGTRSYYSFLLYIQVIAICMCS